MNAPRKKLSRKAKIIILIAICVFAAALVSGAYYLNVLNTYKKDIAAINVQNVDLTAIRDGEYFGDCDVNLVRARVRVVVENQAITEIELLEHHNGRGGAALSLPDRIVEEQRINVDAVSGATASSRVIQEAVYHALTGKHSTPLK